MKKKAVNTVNRLLIFFGGYLRQRKHRKKGCIPWHSNPSHRMNIVDIITVVGPTALVTSLLTFFISRRKENRADIEQFVQLIREDNARLREKERELSKTQEKLNNKVLHMERQILMLQNKLILLESAHNDSPLPKWLKDENGTILALNESYEKTFLVPLGKTMQDYIGKTDFDVWPETIARSFLENDRAAMETGLVDTLELVPNGKGEMIKWRIIKYPRYAGSVLIGISGIAVPPFSK